MLHRCHRYYQDSNHNFYRFLFPKIDYLREIRNNLIKIIRNNLHKNPPSEKKKKKTKNTKQSHKITSRDSKGSAKERKSKRRNRQRRLHLYRDVVATRKLPAKRYSNETRIATVLLHSLLIPCSRRQKHRFRTHADFPLR